MQPIGFRTLQGDSLYSQQLFVIGRIKLREDIAALDHGTLGNHAQQGRRPVGRQPLSSHPHGDILEPAFDDGPLSAFNPPARQSDRKEIGSLDGARNIVLMERPVVIPSRPSPSDASRQHRQNEQSRQPDPGTR